MRYKVGDRVVIRKNLVRPRFPGQCQSARGQSGPKSKPNGDGDGRDG